jgi:glycosyltransferase involved in cell wall biosynthesis
MISQRSSQKDTLGGSGSIRILLIAYACEPGRGSEPGTGWNMALGLAKFHRVTVATRANNRPIIEKFLATHHGPAPDFLFIDPAPWILRLKKQKILPVQLFYYFWQKAVAQTLKREVHEFDILHQLTFNSFEIPPLAFSGAKGIKIWGPVGGGQSVPFRMLAAFGKVGAVKELLRNLRVRLSARNPLCIKILADCSLVLFANNETRRLLGSHCRNETAMMIDVGVDVELFSPATADNAIGKIVILFAGRLEGRKGAILLIQAFADLTRDLPDAELRIVGDGPMRESLEREVRRKGLSQQVVFTGLISHEAMRREFEQADIFAFPSLRDTSGAVVLEAMAMELPIVCFDHQGAAIMVPDTCGRKVAACSCEAAVKNLADALSDLARNREKRRTMGLAGRLHVKENHDWGAKSARISTYYEHLIRRKSTPSFPSA